MNKYSIMGFLCLLSLHALRESNIVSIEKKLTVVFAYNNPDKKDREGKQQLRQLQDAFRTFEHEYRKIGVSIKSIDIRKNGNFVDRYLENEELHTPIILFFERGKLLTDETLRPSSGKELIKTLAKKLEDPESKIGEIVSEVQVDYQEKKEKDAEAARVSAYSIMYPSAWDMYSGFYNPYYPHRTHWGFGLGWHGRYW